MTGVVQFDGLIGPANLLGLVRNAVPFLFTDAAAPSGAGTGTGAATRPRLSDLADHALGWLAILHAAERFVPEDPPTPDDRTDYFALCLASHVATVASFVPTDVDAKIRGVLWDRRGDHGMLERMGRIVLQARAWDVSGVSARLVRPPDGPPVSGHDGEWLGVASGALGCFLATGLQAAAEAMEQAILAELERGAAAFRACARVAGMELDVLRLATVLTHNAGDVDQGLSFWPQVLDNHPARARLQRLAHDNRAGHARTYQHAGVLYRAIMASEGHRNYPLRAVKALRSDPALLLPISPFLDAWGATIASHPPWSLEERAEVVAALVTGCSKIPGQSGYYRALAAIEEGLGGFTSLAKHCPAGVRTALRAPELRRLIAIKRISFESGLRKRAIALLAQARTRALPV